MKKTVCMAMSLMLFLSFPPLVNAQTAVDCDQLRNKIDQLEKMDINAMSRSIQQIYKESLLKLYSQFSSCMQRDITTMTDMQRAVAGTDAAKDVEVKLNSLLREKTETDKKLALMRTALNLDAIATAESARGDGTDQPAAPGITPSIPTSPAIAPQATFTCAAGVEYPEAPELIVDIVSRDAADAVARNDANRAVASASKMVLYTIIDAASPTSSRMLRDLEAYKYLGETARTDKQMGASAKSEGAVSAIEKPGFPELLGFAIEHGAIDKENDGTNLTLSSSLYSLYAFNKRNTAETYQRAGILNRVGFSATFAVDDDDNELANARRNNLTEWSIKARLFGDRSTRSARFQKFWDREIRPVINRRLQAIGGAIEGLSEPNNIPAYEQLQEDVERCLIDQVSARMADADYQSANTEERTRIVRDLMLGFLNANVFARVRDGQLEVKPEAITLIETRYVPNLKVALDDLKSAEGELAKRLEDLRTGPLGTFAYTNHRIPTGSDFSETKFLFEQDKSFFRPLKFTANFGLSFYNKPDPFLNQQRLRDLSAALSFEGSTRSPFIEAENQSKVTFAFVGRYERLFENRRLLDRRPDIGSLQFVTEIPFFKGFSLPLSVTYSNATEEERKDGFRFNFGMRLDMDKLIELLRVPQP